MSDSIPAVIGRKPAPGLADLRVVPEGCGEGEQSLGDAHEDAREGAAVALERELALGHGRRVEQPHPVREGGRCAGEGLEDEADLARKPAQALVVAGLAWHGGEQVP